MPTEEKLDKKEEKIKREAKHILDKFAKELGGIKDIPESYVEREEDRRKESAGFPGDRDFVNRFFDNAPNTKNKCLVAERGKWK